MMARKMEKGTLFQGRDERLGNRMSVEMMKNKVNGYGLTMSIRLSLFLFISSSLCF